MAENVTTVLGKSEATELTADDILYLIKGSGSNRDKKVKLGTIRDFIATWVDQGNTVEYGPESIKFTSSSPAGTNSSELNSFSLVLKDVQGNDVAQLLGKKLVLGSASIEQKTSADNVDFVEFDKTVHIQALNHQTIVSAGKITQTSNGESTTIEGNVVATGTVDADKVDAEEVDTPSVKFGSAEMKINQQGAVELNAEMDVDKLIADESVEAPLIKGASIGDGSASSIVHRKLECGDNSTVSTSLKDGEIILCHVNAGSSSCTITDTSTGTTATLVRSAENSRVWPVCRFGSQIFTLV